MPLDPNYLVGVKGEHSRGIIPILQEILLALPHTWRSFTTSKVVKLHTLHPAVKRFTGSDNIEIYWTMEMAYWCTGSVGSHVQEVWGVMYRKCGESCTGSVESHVQEVWRVMYRKCGESCTGSVGRKCGESCTGSVEGHVQEVWRVIYRKCRESCTGSMDTGVIIIIVILNS